MTNEVDIGSLEKNRELELLPPSDARVRSAIAPFSCLLYTSDAADE